MINHSIVKLTLFLAAGAIYMSAHTLDLNKLRGFGRGKPFLAIVFLIGACSLAGVPGFCGYISKTLVHESIVEYAHHAGTFITAVEWLFLFSGGLTAAYMTKLFVAIFVEKGDGEGKKMKLTLASKIALGLSALPLIVLGVMPHQLSDKITGSMLAIADGHAFGEEINYFSFTNIKGVLISLAIGAIVYFGFIRTVLIKKKDGRKTYICPWSDKLSMEHLLYAPIGKALIFVLSVVCRIADNITDAIVLVLRKTFFRDSKDLEAVNVHKHKFAYALGLAVDRIFADDNHTHAKRFSRVSETIEQTTSQISKNFSFALVMAGLGVCLILVFIVLVF